MDRSLCLRWAVDGYTVPTLNHPLPTLGITVWACPWLTPVGSACKPGYLFLYLLLTQKFTRWRIELERSLWSGKKSICDEREMTHSPRQRVFTQLEPFLLSSSDVFSVLHFYGLFLPAPGELFGSDTQQCL